MSRRWAWALPLFAILALPTPALADHAGPLAAQWHLDVRQGGENQTTPDSSGHGLDASNDLSDALSIAPGGRFGNHLATTPGAVSPAATALLRPQHVTVLGWVRASGPQGILKYVAGQGAEDSPGCGGSSYALYTGTAAGDGLRFYIRPPVGNAQVSPPAGNGIWDNQWHMVAGVWDGSRVRLYVDGVQKGAGTPAPGATINYSFALNRFFMREYPAACGSTNFAGGIDELRVYRRALTSTEIARLAAPGPNPPALVPDAPGVPLPRLPPLATPRFVTTKAVKLSRATWLSGAASTVPAGVKIANYDWDFNGDGRYDGTCDGDTPAASHPFRKAGTHRVGLRLTDQFGRTSVTTRAVSVTSAQRNLAKAAVFTCEDPATSTNQPDRKDCVKTFSFSIIEVNGRGASDQCFTVKSRSPFLSQKAGSSQAAERDRDTRVYNAKIAGPVRLNGLPIPVPRQRLTEYDSGNATISAGNFPVKILMPIPGSTPVTLANVPFEYTIKPTKGRVKLPPLKGSGKLPFFGGLKLGGGIEVHLLKHAAEVFMSLRLPEIFKFSNDRVAEGRVTLRTSNAKDFQFEGLRISGIPQVFLGPLYVSNLFFDYQKTGEIWRGGANFQLAAVSPVEIKAAPPPPDYGFGLRGGRFAYAGGGVGFPNPPRPQIFPGVGLVEIGGAIGIDPIRFTGRMAIDVGGFIVVDGSAFIGLANESDPYDFPEEFAPPGLGFLAGRKLDTVSIGIGGEAKIKVPIVGEVPLINSYVFYQYPAYAEFGGGFKFNVAERFSVDGNVGGFAAPIQRTFNLEGNVKGCVDIEITKFCLNVGAVVSSKGIGFCTIVPLPISPFGPTIPVPAGVGYTWGGSIEPKVFSCDTGPYKEVRPSARSAQKGGSFTLPSGLPSAMVKVTGRGGVPKVELRGPRGERILAPQDDRSRVRNDVVVIPQTPEKRLLIGIKKPSAGRWTVTARSGSAPIAGVASANGLAAPRVKATVRGRGRKRLLSYRISPAAGQRVTFFERGARTYRRLGAARGRRGRIRFAPAAGRRGRREIVAQIERGGVVVKNLVVARYAAARDPRPSRPRRLRVRRRGDSLVIAWRRAQAAFRYGVTVQLSNRRRIFRVTRRRRITIHGVDRRARGVVFVGGLRGDGVAGREAKRRIPKPRSTKRRKR